MRVNLYTTIGCHLCEQAHVMLEHCRGQDNTIEICAVEISHSESLLARYGVRIPVVQAEGAATDLGWPFTLEQLQTYIGNKNLP